MASMKRFLPLALGVVVTAAALPAYAQRGGSHAGSVGHSAGTISHSGGAVSHSGGFAMRSVPTSRPGSSPIGRTPFMGIPQLRYGTSHEISARAPFPSRGPMRGDRPPYYRHTDHPAVDRILRSYLPVYGSSLVYAYPGYLNEDDLNYSDYPPNDASNYATPQPESAPYTPNESQLPIDQAQALPSDAYRPAYVRPQPTQDLGTELPVTLIFKDGRPAEQIQNYMLTRTTLYVQEQHLREIPVADLDLAATQTANKAVGIDFQLPGTVH
jgi:hypothetical protein